MQRQAFTIPTRVVLVDDHPLIREGLAKLFDEIRDIDLVGFATDGETAEIGRASCRERVYSSV